MKSVLEICDVTTLLLPPELLHKRKILKEGLIDTHFLTITAPISLFHYETFVAIRTGLEPVTSGVTGRRSDQLNYRTVYAFPMHPQMFGFHRSIQR